jgi:hypothetical protein
MAEWKNMVLSFWLEIPLFYSTHDTPRATRFVMLKIDTHAVEKFKCRVKI